METIFSYSSLPQGHIRVLQVKRLRSGAVYKLHSVLIDDHLRFRAVSYAWGSPALTETINCNGKTLSVTSSVHELLSSTIILSLGEELPLWIDAICINQRDDLEKADQVRKMGPLYSLAVEVVVWLGPAVSDSDLAMETMRALSGNITLFSHENLSEYPNRKDTLQKYGLANTDDQIPCALGSLFCRKYFQRLWVFQEVVLARRRQVVCGSKMLTWDEFMDGTRAIARTSIFSPSAVNYPNLSSGVQAIMGVQEMNGAVEAKRSNREAFFKSVWLLDIAQRKAVTDPRDRVYGMLGLASSHLRERISVDYSQQGPSASLRLYIDCGKACIEEDSSLGLLCLLSGKEKNPGLPSWCPDFDAPQNRKLYDPPEWKAGIGTAPELENLRGAWFEPDCDDLFAPGCSVDVVCEVVSCTFCWSDMEQHYDAPSMEDATKNLAWHNECVALFRQTYPQHGEIPISYVLTLCEGSLRQYWDNPYMMHQAYNRNVSIWQDIQESMPHREADEYVMAAAYMFFSRLIDLSRGRKFFSTKSGRIGMGPPETQAGDVVSILYGAGPLYLLRYKLESTQILGNTYMHDLMNLDELPEEAKGENVIIVIN